MSIHCLLPERNRISLCWKFLGMWLVWLDSLTDPWSAVGLGREEESRLPLQPSYQCLGLNDGFSAGSLNAD